MPKRKAPPLPPKHEVFEYWRDRLLDLDFFIDWGEPTCWACGEFWNGKYDIEDTEAPYEVMLQQWDKAPLQRRYIIPPELGGTDEPSNLFLLCKECYDLAPHCDIPEIFFQWARAQNFRERHALRSQESRKVFEISDEDFPLWKEIQDSEEFTAFLNQHSSWHTPLSGYESCRGLTLSTFYGLLSYYWKHHYGVQEGGDRDERGAS